MNKIQPLIIVAILFAIALLAVLSLAQAQGGALAALPDGAMLVKGDHELYAALQHAPVVDRLIADYECDCWRLASTRKRLLIVWEDVLWLDVMEEPYIRDRFVVTARLSYNRLAVLVSQPRPDGWQYGDWHCASAVVVGG